MHEQAFKEAEEQLHTFVDKFMAEVRRNCSKVPQDYEGITADDDIMWFLESEIDDFNG